MSALCCDPLVLILCTTYNKLNKYEGCAVNETFTAQWIPKPPPQTEMTSPGLYGSEACTGLKIGLVEIRQRYVTLFTPQQGGFSHFRLNRNAFYIYHLFHFKFLLVCFLTWLLGVSSSELMFNFSVLSDIMK